MTEVPPKEQLMDSNPCNNIIEDLNALEQAIVDMCDIDTVHAIQDRRRMIRKR